MVARRTNRALLPCSLDRAWSPGTQTAHYFPGQSMVPRRTNTALLPRSTVRAWSPGVQTAHCFPTPRTEHGRQAHKQNIAPPLHGQSMAVRHSNTALLPYPPVRAWSPGPQTPHCFPSPRAGHGNKAHKHRIAPLLPGQSMAVRHSNTALLPSAPRTGMVTRRTDSALLPCSPDRTWSPSTQTSHCFPAPWSGMVTKHINKASGAGMVARRTNTALLPRSPDRAWSPASSPSSLFSHSFSALSFFLLTFFRSLV